VPRPRPPRRLLAADRGVAGAFTVSGTVVEVRGQEVILLTTDLTGREQPITVDLSLVSRPDARHDVRPGDPISLAIVAREFDTYLALGVEATSPTVNRLEFGVREEFTTRDDSIRARVGNVPEDDEALAKERRARNLREKDDDEEGDRRRRP
jgi:hypothetical protein